MSRQWLSLGTKKKVNLLFLWLSGFRWEASIDPTGEVDDKMRVGCGGACCGLFAVAGPY